MTYAWLGRRKIPSLLVTVHGDNVDALYTDRTVDRRMRVSLRDGDYGAPPIPREG